MPVWLDKYHIDGLRVDAVASDALPRLLAQSRRVDSNRFGGRENLEAIDFLRRFNEQVYAAYPDTMTSRGIDRLAERVAATYTGGLGFGYKWDMAGCTTRSNTSSTTQSTASTTQPAHLPHALRVHGELHSALSHDEVVHGKQALLTKMLATTGNASPIFVSSTLDVRPARQEAPLHGGEIGQWHEWDHDTSLDCTSCNGPRTRASSAGCAI